MKKIETMGHLVDTKDLFQALAEVKSDILPQETKTYLAYQIRQTCRMMREAAKHVEERIDLFDPPPPKPRRKPKAPSQKNRSGGSLTGGAAAGRAGRSRS